jgi:hypothetical protein
MQVTHASDLPLNVLLKMGPQIPRYRLELKECQTKCGYDSSFVTLTWISGTRGHFRQVERRLAQGALNALRLQEELLNRNSRTEPGSRSTDTFLESDDW